MQDEFLGVHYRVSVAFAQRPVNGRPPNADLVASLARASEEKELVTELDWYHQFVRDWCQGNETHKLVARKPAVTKWRAWYLKCTSLLDTGDTLNKRWRQFLRDMGWDQMSALQRLAFDGSLHEIEPLVKAATAEGRSNPFLGVPNVLVYAVLSRSFETVSFLLQNGFGTPEELRRGETWTGFTALHVALFIGHRDIVSLLWNNYNANVNARDLFFGSALDYCHALGLVTNAEVYFAGMQNRGFGFGYKTFDTLVQLTMRGAYEWNHPQKEIFELRNVKNSDVAFVNYWNMKSKEMERMPLAEWSDLVRCVYQPFVSAKDAWLDELMFNGVYVADPTPELRLRFAPHLTNRQVYKTPETVVMSYLNARVGFGCFAAKDLKQGDFVVNYTGELHTDRYKWKDVEKTTAFRLNFMKQIHDLGEKGKGLIKKQSLPQYLRDPNFNIAIPGTSYFLNSSECGSMGRVINHSSSHWNCEIVIVWNAGVPQALVVTTKDVAKGEQLFLNYGEMWKYFQQKREEKEKGKKSILNFDESEMFQIRGEKEFFALSQEIDLSNSSFNKISI